MGRRNFQTTDEKTEKALAKQAIKIAKFCRFKTPNKKCSIQKEDYEYFTAKNAIDTLYNSRFCQRNEAISRAERQEGNLYTREDCVQFYKNLVNQRSVGRCLKRYKDEETRRKYKIVGHQTQIFTDDDDEIYIWIWNPTPPMHYVYGSGVLLLVIGGTLFPLWPDSLRTGVYYTSVSMAGFIGSVLVTGLLRTIIFGLIWCLTGGKHHFWFLPNLLADVGFFESFKPIMTYEVYDADGKKIKKNKDDIDCQEVLKDAIEEPVEDKKDR